MNDATAPPSKPEETHALISRLLPERLHKLQRASGLPVVFGGAIRWSGAGPRLVISRLIGTQGEALAGLEIETGQGLGGRVLRDAAPGQVHDYSATRDITHDFDEIVVAQERLTSVIAVPVVVAGLVQGVLYGAARDAAAVSDRALRSATTVAAQLQRDVEAALRGTGQGRGHGRGATSTRDPRRALSDLAQLIAETADPVVRERLARIHQDLGGSLARSLSGPPPNQKPLTPRELDVLRVVGAGGTNMEAATELGLSPETVKSYLSSAMRKLGSTNRTAAARAALQWGLLE
ncbi:LuxR C-terminal-related transcriptional regulator [Nocardioides gilvus]|uniref:LuxR C-terminal-related transcriptional regulator n=1 Tax=Nocardioides gilvus TaxID=1735589 RepID=UPI000D74D44F|nr:LuxR C-terminal-related transcriptional regulator [Nocardioides gilvus]